MFNPNHYENSGPAGLPVLEVVPEKESAARLFVPLRRTELAAEVSGPLAACTLIQVFAYSREACDAVLEAVYRFPLPGDAAVNSVRVRFGSVEIRAELKERGKAEQEYEEARSRGKQAVLATRESPDVFTLSVAGLRPDEEVRVETEYVQLARPEGAGWSLRLPLTTAPRYTRSDERDSRPAAGQPLLVMRDPGHRFSLDLRFRGVDRVRSTTHAIVGEREDGAVRIRLRDGDVLPDRDFVVTWQPEQEADRPTLRVLSEEDPEAGDTYFLALAAPPAQPEGTEGVPREVILLVDHSGSMEGPKWRAADWAVNAFLAGLTERDAFNLGVFHHTTRWLTKKTVVGDQAAVAKAGAFLKAARDSGGTELGLALEQALSIPPAAGERARHVLILTDAQVSDAGRIFRLADEEARRSNRRRISILCIDAAPNSFLACELADRGGGQARFLTSDPEHEDITTALDAVLADWSAPVVSGVALELDRTDALTTAGPARSVGGMSRVQLGDLPAGRPVWACGRVPTGTGPLEVRLTRRNGEALATATDAAVGHGLKALFGARRVLALEALLNGSPSGEQLWEQLERLGYDPSEVSAARPGQQRKVYAENARREVSESLRALLVRESLRYGIASAETAFVAVRHEEGKPVDATVAVASALPHGWSQPFLGSPVAAFAAMAAPPPSGRGRGMDRRARKDTSGGVRMLYCFRSEPRADADLYVDCAHLSEPDEDVVYMMAPDRDPPARPAAAPDVCLPAVPAFEWGEAVLFDSQADPGRVPDGGTLTALGLRYPDGDPVRLDPELAVLVFVGDMAAPRARVALQALARMGGERPLNLRREAGDRVRIVLVDPNGAWSAGAPRLELSLRWGG